MEHLQKIKESFNLGFDIQDYMMNCGCSLQEAASAFAEVDEDGMALHTLAELTAAYRETMIVSGSWLLNMVNEWPEGPVVYVKDIESEYEEDARLYSFNDHYYVVIVGDEEDIDGDGTTEEEAIASSTRI
jgi:hypothetical protein